MLGALGLGLSTHTGWHFLFLHVGRTRDRVKPPVPVWFPRAALQDSQKCILIHTSMTTKLVALTPATFQKSEWGGSLKGEVAGPE